MLNMRIVADPGELVAHIAAWQDLAADAIEPNPFYEPWMLLPALEAFGPQGKISFLLLSEAGSLIGLFPLERAFLYRRLPLPHVRLWKYPHCFLGTPLVRRGRAGECLHALRDWLKGDVMHWRDVAGDGPFAAALDPERSDLQPYRRSRALLRRHADPEAYIARALPKASRKEYRRLQARLAEQGGLEYRSLDDSSVEDFLRLEAAGWKGRHGNALASSAAGARFFRSVAMQAASRGRLMMLSLNVAGRPVAMKCNFLAGDGAFAFKIAYDEAYARYSPGVLLELENIRAFHRRPALQWMDSCAAPDHFMANRLWLERRVLLDMLSSLSMLHRMWRSLRGAAPVTAAT